MPDHRMPNHRMTNKMTNNTEGYLAREVREWQDKKPPVARPQLLIRSFEGDNGTRPFSYGVWWLSPDIIVLNSAQNPLPGEDRFIEQGKNYYFKINITNLGLLPAFGTIVEIFVRNPNTTTLETLTTENITMIDRLILKQPIPSGCTVSVVSNNSWVPSGEYVDANGNGHACVGARAYVPMYGVPASFNCLNDTFVAHQNLVYQWVESGETALITFKPQLKQPDKDFLLTIRAVQGIREIRNVASTFQPQRMGLLSTPVKKDLSNLPVVKKGYTEARSIPRSLALKARDAFLPVKSLKVRKEGFNAEHFMSCVVEVPRNLKKGDRFVFNVEKWTNNRLDNGVTYVLVVK